MPATHVRAALGAAAVLLSVPAPGALALPSGGGGRASAPSYLLTWATAFPAGRVARPAAEPCAGAAAPGDEDGGGEMGDKKVALITGITGQVGSGPSPIARAGRGGAAPAASAGRAAPGPGGPTECPARCPERVEAKRCVAPALPVAAGAAGRPPGASGRAGAGRAAAE